MAKAPAKVLYFLETGTPTQEDYEAAENIGRGVVFRNASKIVPGAPLENCDAVMGAVPPDYAAVYPSVDGFEEGTGRILLRPNPSRNTTSGGPDDARPGTVDDGMAHESGTGSSFAGDPYQERARALTERPSQRQGRAVWEKNPERALEPSEAGVAVNTQRGPASLGAWPSPGATGQGNPQADMAPEAVRQTADNAEGALKEARQQNQQEQERAWQSQQQSQQQQQGDDNTGDKAKATGDDGGGKKGGKAK